MGVAVTVVATLTLLAGCASLAGPPRGEFGDLIASAIEDNARGEVSEVDFGHVVAGDWTTMLVVCGGTTHSARDNLGFEWDDLPDPSRADFLSMAIFATNDSVIEYFEAGQDDGWVDHWAFTFCSVPSDEGFEDVDDAQFRIPRDQATLQFTFASSGQHAYWYVSSTELSRLAKLE